MHSKGAGRVMMRMVEVLGLNCGVKFFVVYCLFDFAKYGDHYYDMFNVRGGEFLVNELVDFVKCICEKLMNAYRDWETDRKSVV